MSCIADSACNFYLAIAMLVAAGLEGIERELDPGPPVDVDTYEAGEEALAERGVVRLPRTLGEALAELRADDLARDVLGEELHATFLEYKAEEWRAYNTVVGEWERETYLHLW